MQLKNLLLFASLLSVPSIGVIYADVPSSDPVTRQIVQAFDEGLAPTDATLKPNSPWLCRVYSTMRGLNLHLQLALMFTKAPTTGELALGALVPGSDTTRIFKDYEVEDAGCAMASKAVACSDTERWTYAHDEDGNLFRPRHARTTAFRFDRQDTSRLIGEMTIAPRPIVGAVSEYDRKILEDKIEQWTRTQYEPASFSPDYLLGAVVTCRELPLPEKEGK